MNSSIFIHYIQILDVILSKSANLLLYFSYKKKFDKLCYIPPIWKYHLFSRQLIDRLIYNDKKFPKQLGPIR